MDNSENIIKKIRGTILQYGMISQGDRIVVAVSGGPDSICLLNVLNRISKDLEIELVVAHLNHGLRPDEDEVETQLVWDLARSMNVPFETEKASDLRSCISSLEERARNARYEYLERIRAKHKAQKIAMGHNLNDQAETVIMRFLRGSGPSGLAGIPPVRGRGIIRPLIGIKRDEIMH
jgi:tRNA(Ile)-lysidine synthase